MAVFRILLAVAVTLGRLLPFLIVAAALFLLWRRGEKGTGFQRAGVYGGL